ncbi:TolC family protein [Sulfurimonas sp. NW15]|uniref:TolC family protein n=1 Tax=Sulfurimonas sp. NW15 TaxID=2922729 RepID=UPI003DA98F54
MKTVILGIFLLCSGAQAVSLSEIIDISLAKKPSLEAINERIEANRYNIAVSDQFENPQLLITKNTLNSSQAMSQSVVTFKQKIPFYNKRETNKKIAEAEDALLQEKLNAAKTKLVAQIKSEAYTIWKLNELYKIIDEYVTLTQQNIDLYESYTSIDENQHIGIMKAELSLSDLQIQKSILREKINAAYARLSYLASFKVHHLDINIQMGEKPDLGQLQKSLAENPDIKIKDKEILKQNAKLKMADLNNYPDINLIAGYALRENFNNYFNFGFGLSLPIYGTEDYKEEEARALVLSATSQKADTQISVNAELEAYYAQMLSSYEIYHIIQDEALPQVAHMFELSSSSISVGADLFKYIDVLFQKLDLEQKSIKAVANYNLAQAKIAQLKGELQ